MATPTRSIANEIQLQVKEKRPFTIFTVLKNRWFLYAVSITAFFLVWDTVAYRRIFGGGLARPQEVITQLGKMMVDPIAGKSLLGHVWASTQRILIGFSLAPSLGVVYIRILPFAQILLVLLGAFLVPRSMILSKPAERDDYEEEDEHAEN